MIVDYKHGGAEESTYTSNYHKIDMTKKLWQIMCCFFLAALCIQSCKKEEKEENNSIIPTQVDLVKYDIEHIKDILSKVPENAFQVTSDSYIKGVITSNGQSGNFANTAFFQDKSGGLKLILKQEDQLNYGDSVKIFLKNKWIRKDGQMYRIDTIDIKNEVIVGNSNNDVKAIQLTSFNAIQEHYGELIEVKNAQFSQNSLGNTFANTEDQTPGVFTLENTNEFGFAKLRTNPTALFAKNQLPEGNGTITAIVTEINDQPQLLLPGIENLKFDGDRKAPEVINIASIKNQLLGNDTLTTLSGYKAIQGVINMNDEAGNLQHEIIIQNKEEAISIDIDQNNLFKKYPVGSTIKISLMGTTLYKHNGEFHIALKKEEGDKVEKLAIPAETAAAIISSCDMIDVPEVLTSSITDLQKEHLGQMIKINGLQFVDNELDKPYVNVNDNYTFRILTDRTGNTIPVFTLSDASFAEEIIPSKSGDITAVLAMINKKMVLRLRKTEEVNFTKNRFDVGQNLVATTSIQELKSNPNGTLPADKVIRATISMNDQIGNFPNQVQLQDGKSGITLVFEDNGDLPSYNVGQEFLIKLGGLDIYNDNGTYAIGKLVNENGTQIIKPISKDEVESRFFNTYETNTIEPINLSIKDISQAHSGAIIKINNIQFEDLAVGQKYVSNNIMTERGMIDMEGNKLNVKTYPSADIANFRIPENSGSITALCHMQYGVPHLIIRNIEEVALNQPRFGVTPNLPKVTIAEIKAMFGSEMTEITVDKMIEASVIATDKNGNLYKRIFIQDATGGIQLNINATGLHETFPVGSKIAVLVKGLYVDHYGDYKIGVKYVDVNGNNKLGGIAEAEIGTTVSATGSTEIITPLELDVSNINNSYVNTLVRINNVQFIDAELGKDYTEESTNTNRTLTDAQGNQLIVRTSLYADFHDQALPEGSGSITAVLTQFGTTYQLVIRDINEVNLNNSRFEVNSLEEISIADLKASYTGEGIQAINMDKIVNATVVADDSNGNIYKLLYIQDATGGIHLKINKTSLNSDFPVGTKIALRLKELSYDKYGEVRLGVPYTDAAGKEKLGGIDATEINSFITVTGNNSPLSPLSLDLNSIDENLVGALVKVEQVQFIDADLGTNYADGSTATFTNRTITNASGNTIIVITSKYANYADQTVAEGSGSMIAILAKFNETYELIIRNIDEVDMNDPRF